MQFKKNVNNGQINMFESASFEVDICWSTNAHDVVFWGDMHQNWIQHHALPDHPYIYLSNFVFLLKVLIVPFFKTVLVFINLTFPITLVPGLETDFGFINYV